MKYFYEGNYPEKVEDEFERWVERVEAYVKKLESGIGARELKKVKILN